MDNILKCRKCGEYPQISAYRNGTEGYTVMINCRCTALRQNADIIKWATSKAVEKWNEQNGGTDR